MKTFLACAAIVTLALLAGLRQQRHLSALERKITALPPRATVTAAADRGQDSVNALPGKSRTRPVPIRAAEVYQTIIAELDTRGRGVNGGSACIQENRVAFSAMMKLDLAGQKELISLLANSTDPKFREALFKCEQINVCLCAMADRHPGTALEYLEHADEKIGPFYNDRMSPEPMVQYVLFRLCDHDAVAGMDALVRTAERHKESWGSSETAQMISKVNEQDAELALGTIGRLPEDKRPDSWRILVQQAETNEECGRIFNHVRGAPLPDQAKMTGILQPLFANVRGRMESWQDFASWLDGMNLSAEEKKMAAAALPGDMDDEKHVAKWLLDSIPASRERNYLLWRTTTGLWRAADPSAVELMLRQQGIDPEEMSELNREGYLRPSY